MPSPQQVFDKVALHLLTQKKQSMNGAECMYRGVDGTMCAVGCLIKDEHYTDYIENRGAASDCVVEVLAKSLNTDKAEVFNYVNMLVDLQSIHDNMEPYGWFNSLYHAAKRHGVEWTWRVQPVERAIVASVLEDAANYIWNGKTDCPNMSEGEAYSEFTSLHLLNEVRKYSTDYIKFAQELVYSRMKNHGDMWGFLLDKGVSNTEITQELLQLHRKQWLHALAEEVRGKNVLES